MLSQTLTNQFTAPQEGRFPCHAKNSPHSGLKPSAPAPLPQELWTPPGLAAQPLKIYESKIPHLMADSVNVLPAALFYTVHLAGTTYLVVRPGDETRTHLDRLRDGAVLGVIAWGTFGLTNAAVLDCFPLSIALVDTVWGGVLTGTVALVAGKTTEISRAKKSEGA